MLQLYKSPCSSRKDAVMINDHTAEDVSKNLICSQHVSPIAAETGRKDAKHLASGAVPEEDLNRKERHESSSN